jgi:signal transduction histidine kinase
MYVGIERRSLLLKLVSPGPKPEKAKVHAVDAVGSRTLSEAEAATNASEVLSFRTLDGTRRLLRDLQVRGYELERQNTELRLASDKVQEALERHFGLNEKLEQANLELDAFNSSVSHELCTPLATISGFAEVLQKLHHDQGRQDDQSQRYLQGIAEGTLRMKRLIENLLDFSRVTRVELRRESFDLSVMARSVAAELKLTAPEGHLRFVIPRGLRLQGDPGLCRIILDNLLGNAWKHAGHRAQTVIEVGMTELAGKPVCFVCDNGPGFSMAEAGRLFLPFQRIPGIAAAGHGIGLATVKRIVKRHGGRVWAESNPGEGATFFFTLE